MVKNPPCSLYEGTQLLYTKNGKKFCRNSKKKNILKKKENQCSSLSPEKIIKYSKLLNIPDNEDTLSFCYKIDDIIQSDLLLKDKNYKDIDFKLVCDILDITDYKKPPIELLKIISDTVLDKSSRDIKKMIKDVLPNNVSKEQLGYMISKLILNDVKKKNTSQISNKLTKKLLVLKKKGILNDDTEKQLLEDTLKTKLKKCVDKVLLQSKFLNKKKSNKICYTKY